MRRFNPNRQGAEILIEILLYLLYSRQKPGDQTESQKVLGSHGLNSLLDLDVPYWTCWPFPNVGGQEAVFSEQGRTATPGPLSRPAQHGQ